MAACLAFDTATEQMSIALAVGDRVWRHDAPGGAQASHELIPAILQLLGNAGFRLADLQAIAFGRGPGAFTGLRTACSVAQGLAFGASLPVLPIDTLLAVAEDARRANAQAVDVWVAMDARMDEVYAAHYRHDQGQWRVQREPALYTLDALNTLWRAQAPLHVAGSAVDAFAGRLELAGAAVSAGARPTAVAMLPLAQALWLQGGAVDAAQALPLYLRDKVALTTAEREVVKAAKEAGRVT